ncbi:MAG: peroxiredoxin [Alphaproteobacteria bacterium]|nr:peroxiredoxin [Alphaproteobacteria bacterium]
MAPQKKSSKKTTAKATPKKTVKKPAVKPVKKAVKAKPATATKALTVGSKAPAFSMPSTLLGTASLASLSGKPFVLYFYPKDDTSGCTAEACDFRDQLPGFKNLKATVIGVSKDSIASHEKFAKKYELTFPLASDEKTKVCEAFGTWAQKSMYGRSYMGIERSTFLIDGKGIIRAVWRKVSVPGHVAEVAQALQDIT